jgi:cysteine desulfurase / selenocysteine lyase
MKTFEEIRKDFPILEEGFQGKQLAYLDSGASSQKPIQVIRTLEKFYLEQYANIHRGIYALSADATEMYDEARRKVTHFINANTWREVVFTRNTTESINLVAYSWGSQNIKNGDAILISEMEHHANHVPWLQLCERTGAELRFIPLTPDGQLDMNAFDRLLDERVKLVAITSMSNVLGTITPAAEIARKAHSVGAIVLLDGAQSVPHMPTDVQALDCDFLAFSSHKMLGPTGIGVLYGKRALLEAMPPFLTGGDMIHKVDYEKAEWAPIPQKFEAGTPAIAETIGLGAAIDYLSEIGMDRVRQHEIELTDYAIKKLVNVEGVRVLGPHDPTLRGAAISFTFGNVHPHDLGSILDHEAIAIRAGHHCAMPLHRKLGIPASARASLYIYNTTDDIDRLVVGLDKASEIFGG